MKKKMFSSVLSHVARPGRFGGKEDRVKVALSRTIKNQSTE